MNSHFLILDIFFQSVNPGLVKTDFIDAVGDPKKKGTQMYKVCPFLEPEHITQAVFYILSAPPIVNVSCKTFYDHSIHFFFYFIF